MYYKKNERGMLCSYGYWCLGGVVILTICAIYCRSLPEILICLFFALSLMIIGIIGIKDIKKRSKEIQELISGNKYLSGYPEGVAVPEYVVFIKGNKCMTFACISEIGREYHFQSEPFDTRKAVFFKDTLYKIYVDNLEYPKKYYVSDEIYYDL